MNIQMNNEQENAINSIMQGKDVILLGAAGTGKSTVISEAIESLEKKGLQVRICAPTGTAARIVQGRTVHNLFDYQIGVRPRNYERTTVSADIEQADAIIVDEVSMVRVDLMEWLIKDAKQKKKPAQLILCGDYKQLQPVISSREKIAFKKQWGGQSRLGYAFDSNEYKRLDVSIIHLTEPMRQKADRRFFDALSRIGNGDYGGVVEIMERCSREEFEDAIYLYPRKSQVEEKNLQKLKEIKKREYIYSAKVIDDSFLEEMQQPKTLRLKEGCRVMSLVNEANGAYFNGSLGTIISCEKDHVVVRFDETEGVYEIGEYEYKWPVYNSAGEVDGEKIMGYHLPLTLAYATTHHKCQGQTYSRANIAPQCFTGGELYTVLTRVRDVCNMHLLSRIRRSDLIVPKDVRNYYRQLELCC